MLVMVALSIYGMRRIPPEKRLPARAGPTGLDFTVGRGLGLMLFPFMGVIVLVGAALAEDDTLGLLGIAVLLFLLFAQGTAISKGSRD